MKARGLPFSTNEWELANFFEKYDVSYMHVSAISVHTHKCTCIHTHVHAVHVHVHVYMCYDCVSIVM